MEVKVVITHELGASTVKALSAIFSGATADTAKAAKMEVVGDAEVKAPAPKNEEQAAPKAEKAKPAPKAEKAKPGPKGKPTFDADAFAALDGEDQLEAIKQEVTKHSKKGKTEDMKAIIKHFGAARASEIDADKYGAAYAALMTYGDGATVADALAGIGDDEDSLL